ncbi:uncharacterized protein C8Q71DRAFT_722178 [Rhodofomes roseus]|uniref:Uncharacterized protein n=1 Tax=Rhodofomes roseus TaxID=34475 RepID=A0ABQ8KLH1_9APHY|nr:uncharacterized protein C8Q71DRAFT_722178 [Rhodofomes roseus]KAH9839174.1 hypothetical protein C8Q71DRAFT_722178 [Rhodofomes roseus]
MAYAMSNVKGPSDPRRVYSHEDYNGPNNLDPSKPNLKDTSLRQTSVSHARAINRQRMNQITGHGSTDTAVSRLACEAMGFLVGMGRSASTPDSLSALPVGAR